MQRTQPISKIAIVTDEPGWHGAQLRRAFAAQGWATVYVSLADCGLDLERYWHGLVLPGFEQKLPAGVFVRGVPGGTLEQVVLRLDVLHALRELGVPVYNDARAIERSVDKAMTSFLLQRGGVATPATWATESTAHARAVLLRETALGRELVLKPLFGSQGKGLQRLRRGMDVPDLNAYNNVAYLQRYIETGGEEWQDWRVFVIGSEAVAAMIRRGKTWINNVAQGARCVAAVPDERVRDLAQRAVRAVGMDYAGVDVVCDRDGLAFVLEVNSIPAWKGLQSVTSISLAQRLVADFIERRLRQPAAAAS
jgi:RimK family alpha-L-glutamate ligase